MTNRTSTEAKSCDFNGSPIIGSTAKQSPSQEIEITYIYKRRIPMSEFTDSGERVEGASGLRIFFRSLRPKAKPRAVVIIVPGFNAHSGYYTWVAEQFVATGLAVYAVDLRGRGNSDGERFYVENFEDYVRDVEAVVKVAKSQEPNLPFFLLGHSAGGVVSCLYALD